MIWPSWLIWCVRERFYTLLSLISYYSKLPRNHKPCIVISTQILTLKSSIQVAKCQDPCLNFLFWKFIGIWFSHPKHNWLAGGFPPLLTRFNVCFMLSRCLYEICIEMEYWFHTDSLHWSITVYYFPMWSISKTVMIDRIFFHFTCFL